MHKNSCRIDQNSSVIPLFDFLLLLLNTSLFTFCLEQIEYYPQKCLIMKNKKIQKTKNSVRS